MHPDRPRPTLSNWAAVQIGEHHPSDEESQHGDHSDDPPHPNHATLATSPAHGHVEFRRVGAANRTGARPKRRMTIDREPMRDGKLAASQYDAMGTTYRAANDEGPFNAYYERPGTIALIGDVNGQRVLEAGCGPGALTAWLADNGASVTAMDVSPEMVRLATERLGHRARILNADLAEPLGFAPDASADLVVASLVMHYLADWTGPLAEFYRVLEPDGAVVFYPSPGDGLAAAQPRRLFQSPAGHRDLG